MVTVNFFHSVLPYFVPRKTLAAPLLSALFNSPPTHSFPNSCQIAHVLKPLSQALCLINTLCVQQIILYADCDPVSDALGRTKFNNITATDARFLQALNDKSARPRDHQYLRELHQIAYACKTGLFNAVGDFYRKTFSCNVCQASSVQKLL